MMKNFKQAFKRWAGIVGMMCLLGIALTSCIKDNNDNIPQQPIALLSVINASPDSPPLNFALDNSRANNQPIYYGGGLDYLQAYTGKRNATFVNASSGQLYKTDTLTLKADTYYSLFLTNVAANPEYLLLTDSISRPASGMATVRLVNVSPDAPAVDLAIQGGDVIASNKAYKGHSAFVPVAGNKTYTFEIRQAGTSNVLATTSNITVNSNSVYTVWLQGLSAATDDKKLTAKVQNNVYFY
ncbi:DUF4397 domain-containing protein [Mucilaginibacter segetis]|uniref:DUF4397 domain-containing protein n=1 Tax=Mucilaginibacter segetis TaxID=2793071 RepID=A0A934PVU1_9SPHI|nr:DUF4397 domain-containing protein [Mucilaginibacter segetis]MBK0380477.1 DUF4397 domain-containing protein [Mucilaginibacter segetis]